MKAYIERAREHDEFMKVQTQEFKIGKRHLANMMGEDPETFTQEDVNVNKDYFITCKSCSLNSLLVLIECHRIFVSIRATR